mmetsp:Transcript_7281/g.12467  ORF Transcript_7281/g.12467 Transcript_7281/m.12467 type:complete len:208 (+) Transcript_7281:771-1394(+)
MQQQLIQYCILNEQHRLTSLPIKIVEVVKIVIVVHTEVSQVVCELRPGGMRSIVHLGSKLIAIVKPVALPSNHLIAFGTPAFLHRPSTLANGVGMAILALEPVPRPPQIVLESLHDLCDLLLRDGCPSPLLQLLHLLLNGLQTILGLCSLLQQPSQLLSSLLVCLFNPAVLACEDNMEVHSQGQRHNRVANHREVFSTMECTEVHKL